MDHVWGKGRVLRTAWLLLAVCGAVSGCRTGGAVRSPADQVVTVQNRLPPDAPKPRFAGTLDESVIEMLSDVPAHDTLTMRSLAELQRPVETIPTPMTDPCNAALRCSEKGYGIGKHGGFETAAETIRISARLVQELLAGVVTHEQFSEYHRWGDTDDCNGVNPFIWWLSNGRLISAIEVLDCGDEDDNQLEFRFGPPDPAVSPFRGASPSPNPIISNEE